MLETWEKAEEFPKLGTLHEERQRSLCNSNFKSISEYIARMEG